jgi:hypothetical protein
MRIEELHVGMKIRHPQYGEGVVRSISEHTAQIRFLDETRTIEPSVSGIEPADPQSEISGLRMPLRELIRNVAEGLIEELGVERPSGSVDDLGTRWRKGTLVLRPSDPTLQPKEIPLENFFHKIVMMRNNFRVLEQKINGHAQLSDAEKVEMQQYISRCYGSMTTFNVLFRKVEDQFTSKSGE